MTAACRGDRQPARAASAPRAEAAGDATRGSAIKLGAELLGRAIALVTSLLIARRLGPAEFGSFAFLSGIAVLSAEVADLGLHGTASRALVSRTLALRAMLRTKGLLLFLPCGLGVLALLLMPAERSAGLRLAVFAPLVLYYVFAGWSEFLGVALRARGMRGSEAATLLCFRASALLLAAIALGRGLGLTGLAWALALSPAAAILLGFSLLLRAGERQPAGELEAKRARDILRLAFPLGLNGALALLSLRVEILVLPFVVGDEQTGLFAAALKVVDSLILVPAAIAAGAMPALTREAQKREGPVRERTLTSAALLGVPGAVGLFVLAPDIVFLLFGPEYAEAGLALRLLAPALLLVFLNTVLLHALIALGRAPLLPRLTAARVGLACVCAPTLIPAFGISGAALGFTLSELLLLPLAARACAREGFAVPLRRGVSLAAALSLPMALVLALRWSGALWSIALGGLTYGATLLAAWRALPGLFSPPAPAGPGRS
jgi:O-antigen/teichoic acid export membrane protein